MIILELCFWILLAGFFAGLETGIYSINKVRLYLKLEGEHIQASVKNIQKLLQDQQSLICMTLLYTNIGIHFATAIATKYVSNLNIPINSELMATLVLTPFIFIFGETVPKNIFRNQADTLIYKLSHVIWLSKMAIYPFIWPLKLIIKGICFFVGTDEKRQEHYLGRPQISQLLFTVKEEGVISNYQNMIATNIMRMEEILVKHAMIKFKDVTVLAPEFNETQLIQATKEKGYSRFPVYDTTTQKIYGIANFFDLYYSDDRKPCIRPAMMIEKELTIREALNISCHEQQPMLIVAEKGLPIGIVTQKNLLECIVGKLSAW